LISGSLIAFLFAMGWWFSLAPIFDAGITGIVASFGLGAGIGLIIRWQVC
jgi:hypothetical protein